MYNAAVALNQFFSGFGIPAVPVGMVNEAIKTPYITYSLNVPEWNQKASMYAQIWNRSEDFEYVIQKADQITRAIGQMKKIPFNGGYLVIWPESPLIQTMVDGDYRSAYINLSVNTYQLPGY